jgi:hypothetical protein
MASGGLNELYKIATPAAPRVAPEEPEGEGTEFEIIIDKSYADQELVVQRRNIYWGFKLESTFAGDALKLDLPLPGLASMPGQVEELNSRFVRLELDEVAKRRSLKQIREESLRRVQEET